MNTVTTTTGGDPLGTCFALAVGVLLDRPEKTYTRNRKPKHTSASVRILPRLNAARRDDRGRKGGGFEVFREGYAKCIL